MSLRLHFHERVLAGGALAVLLTMALARSPLWELLRPAKHLLPARYMPLFEVLPGTPDVAFVVLALLIVLVPGFMLRRQPLLVPAVASALVLAYATYPWGLVHWHLLFVNVRVVYRPMTPVDWVVFALPVLLLLVVPSLLQARAVLNRYRAKGVERSELAPVERHLLRQTLFSGAFALAIVLVVGALVHAVAAVATPGGVLVANNLVVVLVITGLMVAALAVGTGMLRSNDGPQKEA